MSFQPVAHVGLTEPFGTATAPKTTSLAAAVVPLGPEENSVAVPEAVVVLSTRVTPANSSPVIRYDVADGKVAVSLAFTQMPMPDRRNIAALRLDSLCLTVTFVEHERSGQIPASRPRSPCSPRRTHGSS